ncbi:MAG TPA: acetylxylan esterase, partial [Candidatus Eremiobacteraceae bacterium]|nr:acetylxylan esterase [Candidatus Eremiobacteraceae bacterium]
MVCHGLADGEGTVIRACIGVLLAGASVCCSLAGTDPPPPEFFRVLNQPLAPGPRITPYLRYQAEQAWKEDEARQKAWDAIRDEASLRKVLDDLRQKLLQMIGGLPSVKTDLHAVITGKIPMDGFTIEKLVYQSLPGIYVSALVYVPNEHASKHPAVLVPAGHAANGKLHYQALSQRLAKRGYIVISWDPVGQGERSQFWDAKRQKSRYNLICAEHAVMGNLAYLAGANLARWEVWDGIRAVDYLLTRPDVDGERISITGTSGGGTQTALIAALDPRIKVAVPSCYITSLPMRMSNRIFVDPDSDPEQDLFGTISNGVDHPGLLLLMYPRPVMVAAAVLDFFPIEGARRTFRELQEVYIRFGHGDRIAMVEGYHGHQYSTENQQAALDFLDHFNRMPARTGLHPVKEPDSQTLQCTRTGQVLLDYSDGRPLTEVIREYYEEHKSGSARTVTQEYYGDKYSGVKNWRVSEYAGVLPQAGEITWEAAGSSKFEEATIDRFLLRHSGQLEMPLLFIHKPGTGERKAALWFRDNGKATSEDWPEIEKYLNHGFDVISFDFRGLGETRMAYTAVSADDPLLGALDFDHAYVNPISGVLANYVYNSLLIGRPYFLQMMEDAEIAKRFAAQKLHANLVAVTAPGDAYTLASAIAEALPGITLSPAPNGKVLKWSEILEQKRESWPIQYLLPGGAYIH